MNLEKKLTLLKKMEEMSLKKQKVVRKDGDPEKAFKNADRIL